MSYLYHRGTKIVKQELEVSNLILTLQKMKSILAVLVENNHDVISQAQKLYKDVINIEFQKQSLDPFDTFMSQERATSDKNEELVGLKNSTTTSATARHGNEESKFKDSQIELQDDSKLNFSEHEEESQIGQMQLTNVKLK